MKDFAVSIVDELTGQRGLYMYIGFTERLSEDHSFVDCRGSAIVLLDGTKEYQFDYTFGHTPDWISITDIVLKPVQKYTLDMLQLIGIADDIVNQIRNFISQWN